MLNDPVKYHVVKIDEQSFLILYLICEIAVVAVVVYVGAYITGHYWSNRFYRGAMIDSYFKHKLTAEPDSDDDEKTGFKKGKVSTFKKFNVPWLYIMVEHLVNIIYGFLCCLNMCRSLPLR